MFPNQIDKVTQNKMLINGAAINCLSTIHRTIVNGWKAFWENPNVTAQENADAFGTDCVNVFRQHAELVKLYQAAVAIEPSLAQRFPLPSKYMNAGSTYTINQNGTITIDPQS